jgi:hypothetical protein
MYLGKNIFGKNSGKNAHVTGIALCLPGAVPVQTTAP